MSGRGFRLLLLIGLLGPLGCGEQRCRVALEGEACGSSGDCVEAGFNQLACVDGRCRATCLIDADCRALVDPECEIDEEVRSAICEQQLCRPGCPQVACPSGETCLIGRCAFYREGFEGTGDEIPSLAGLGWGGGGTLRNPSQDLAFDCDGDCGGVDPGGPAAEGRRFAVLGTEPAPEKGTARTAPTCRACACCLDCILNPPLVAPSILDCPLQSVEPRLNCGPARQDCDTEPPPDQTPIECQGVCESCDACQARATPVEGGFLTSCEQRAADRVCSACPACDEEACRSCRSSACAEPCEDALSEACERCEEEAGCADCSPCRDCTVCEDAQRPGPRQLELRARCETLGADGCFSTPVDYPRAQLTEAEQALTSPPIDLSGAAGPLFLEFRYVPFNIGSVRTVSEQGTSACDWTEGPQEVRVQACAGSCDSPEAWVDLVFEDGIQVLPPDAQRSNGLRLTGQSGIDWSIGRARAALPAQLLGAETRIRFLPRLSEFARIGVDDIQIRSRP
ncbi:MAG: hypothetical protein AAF627_10525 [Myxococcota bacterium]